MSSVISHVDVQIVLSLSSRSPFGLALLSLNMTPSFFEHFLVQKYVPSSHCTSPVSDLE